MCNMCVLVMTLTREIYLASVCVRVCVNRRLAKPTDRLHQSVLFLIFCFWCLVMSMHVFPFRYPPCGCEKAPCVSCAFLGRGLLMCAFHLFFFVLFLGGT